MSDTPYKLTDNARDALKSETNEPARIFLEKPVEGTVLIFQTKHTYGKNTVQYIHDVLTEQMKTGVIVLDPEIELLGWVSPETEVHDE